METSFALVGKGYLIIAADTTAARSVVKMKVDEEKIKTLGPHLLMAYSGEPGAYGLPNTLVNCLPLPQATPFNLLNTLNVASAYIKSVISTHCDHLLLPLGSGEPSQSPFDHANHTSSICSSVDTIQQQTNRISIGLTTLAH